MNCIIIDNEINAIKNLSALVTENFSNLNIVATCTKIAEGVKAVNTHNPNVVFLDVELNNETGFDLFNYFANPQFDVVFCSAHEKYALRAIKSSCFDFLVKPILLADLINVIEKLKIKTISQLPQKIDVLKKNIKEGKQFSKIVVPTHNEFYFINTSEIVCLRADNKYTHVYTTNNTIHVSSKNIGEYEEILNTDYFFRCHRSWIVNINEIKKFTKNNNLLTLSNNIHAEVSIRKREAFLERFLGNY